MVTSSEGPQMFCFSVIKPSLCFHHSPIMSVVRSCCFISCYSSCYLDSWLTYTAADHFSQSRFNSRPLIFTTYTFQKIVTVTFENASSRPSCVGTQYLSSMFASYSKLNYPCVRSVFETPDKARRKNRLLSRT